MSERIKNFLEEQGGIVTYDDNVSFYCTFPRFDNKPVNEFFEYIKKLTNDYALVGSLNDRSVVPQNATHERSGNEKYDNLKTI
jgi:hypothetical protein